ncbi:uncharacterized protein [Antedon mediterranea]|uniref:uncharacterized protein n=1 Tax=Antedon mediterranea TaxID=105859 RepID=UPI003AF5F973
MAVADLESISHTIPSRTTSFESIPEVVGTIEGRCDGAAPLTPSGKKKHMVKMLTLILLPIIVLTTLAIADFITTVRHSMDATETYRNVRLSQQIGSLVHSLQRERDMTALYISSLLGENGPERKTFLINTYPTTDEVLQSIDDWPVEGTTAHQKFHNKDAFINYLFKYRLTLENHNITIYDVIHFYTDTIQIFINWLSQSVRRSGGQGIWETLVAFQFVIVGMEQIGIERTLGAVFFTKGGFDQRDYLWYMKKRQVGESCIGTSKIYSPLVTSILDEKLSWVVYDFQTAISKMRKEVAQNNINRLPSWQEGTWWFENMTMYIDTLNEIQSAMAVIILSRLDAAVETDRADLAMSIGILVVVISIGIVIVKSVEILTASCQGYTLKLAEQTHSLNQERKRTDTLLNQLLPKSVVKSLKCNQNAMPEAFSMATILFSDIVEFTRICSGSTPIQVVDMLNTVYTVFDRFIGKYDVYKVETIGDAYMIVSGVPKRNGNKHGREIALIALDLLQSVKSVVIPHKRGVAMTVRIGIHSGPVVAGIVGSKMPRYCLFGDTVNMASRMESNGLPNRIQVSEATHKILSNVGGFSMTKRGGILIKGCGLVKTYWLHGKQQDEESQGGKSSQGELNLPGQCVDDNNV